MTIQRQRVRPTQSLSSSTGGILQRACACGKHTVAGGECAECAKNKSVLQRKLAIGATNDPLEREAERVADQVLAAPAHPAVGGAPLRIQRFAGQVSEGVDTAPASVDRVLAGSGRPLNLALQHDMEQRFGHDFSQVRVHSGAAAEQSARDVSASAYTVGHNIVFGAGRFVPGTHEGRRLIAHELTHVVQQAGVNGSRVGQSGRKGILSPIAQPLGRVLPDRASVSERMLRRAPGNGESSPLVASLPSTSENQARLAELMDKWVPDVHQQRTTTISRAAAIELKTGRSVYLVAIAGEGAALPLDRSLLMPDEIPVPYAGGHAEIQTMHFAAKEGYKILPGSLEPSRAFCTNCAFWARHQQLTSPHARVRLGQRVVPLAGVSDRELAENADVRQKPGWRGELTEKGKAKRRPNPAPPVDTSAQSTVKPTAAPQQAVAPSPTSAKLSSGPAPTDAAKVETSQTAAKPTSASGTPPVISAPKVAGPTPTPATPSPKPAPKPESPTPTKNTTKQNVTSAQSAQTLGALASVAGAYAKSGAEDTSAANARREALDEFDGSKDGIFEDLWNSPGQGMNISFTFLSVTPKNGLPGSLVYLGMGQYKSEYRTASGFVGFSKEKEALRRDLKASPGLTVEEINRSIWIKPVRTRDDRKDAVKPTEGEGISTPVASFNAFIESTVSIGKGNLFLYELSAYESLKQSSLTFVGYLANFDGHRFQIPQPVYDQLLTHFDGRVHAQLAKKQDGLNRKLEFYAVRLKERREEGFFSKIINQRGDIPLDPSMFNAPRSHLASAAGTIRNGAYRHAKESLDQAEALLNEKEAWLFRYDKGYFPAWADPIE